jgi:hypothetical protein
MQVNSLAHSFEAVSVAGSNVTMYKSLKPDVVGRRLSHPYGPGIVSVHFKSCSGCECSGMYTAGDAQCQ